MRSTSPLFQPASRLSFSITHVLLLFVIGLLVVDSAHAQCTTSWTNAGGGLWSDAGNWDDGVPDAADDACLTLDATYTVDLDVDATVNSLTLGAMSGANTQALAIGPFDDLTVLMPSTITADGEIVWSGGSLNGPGAGVFNNAGLITLTGASVKTLAGDNGGAVDPVLRNTGTVSHEEGQLNANLSAGVENAGLYDLQADVDLDYASGNAPGFTNEAAGTLRKSTGGAQSFFDVPFTNS
ncbi:MAG: hypothetical protein R3181_12225, partial [Rubricoccaceae bacterium]|nr:hypothetical protein [Rubricoccaceae bacterium]